MKTRLDVTIFERGLTPSRENARALIMAGNVYVNGEKATKAGFPVTEADEIELRGLPARYVSRGGFKLEKALSVFSLDVSGLLCGDFGASTGGFTDCLLQNGARKVYAVDVGYGQLAWKLRTDDRVVCLERQNVRHVTEKEIPEKLDFFTVDVSFISLKTVLPAIFRLLAPGASGVCLIKPQFEAGRDKVGKHGVVRDIAVHEEVIASVVDFVRSSGYFPAGLSFSPITGPEGNIEFLLLISSEDSGFEPQVASVCRQAHETLKAGKE